MCRGNFIVIYEQQGIFIFGIEAKYENKYQLSISIFSGRKIFIKLFQFEFFEMANTEKRNEQRFCTCKNSKCMKLYCDCFAARVPCGKNCRCFDCQNTNLRDPHQRYYPDKKLSRQQIIKNHKGCACRRSNCVKKYCDCFQSGILCRDSCKCVDCQNNQSLTNRKVINQLRKNNSQLSNTQNSINLYPLYISQNSQHLKSIIAESNPLTLEENWLDKAAKVLYSSALNGNTSRVFDNFLSILSQLQQNMTQQNLKFKEDYSEEAANIVQSNMKLNSGDEQYQQESQRFRGQSEQYEKQEKFSYNLPQGSHAKPKAKIPQKQMKQQLNQYRGNAMEQEYSNIQQEDQEGEHQQ